MSFMRREALESAAAVRRCLSQGQAFADIGARLRQLDPPFAVVCARGSSGHAGTYLRTLLGKHLGLTAAAAMPSLSSVYARPQRLLGRCISRSRSPGAVPT
jgi:glutamine---fructose-6-phosphate transaminase (isomerizing)